MVAVQILISYTDLSIRITTKSSLEKKPELEISIWLVFEDLWGFTHIPKKQDPLSRTINFAACHYHESICHLLPIKLFVISHKRDFTHRRIYTSYSTER